MEEGRDEEMDNKNEREQRLHLPHMIPSRSILQNRIAAQISTEHS